jgi:predicted PurR-regulated permease PerM
VKSERAKLHTLLVFFALLDGVKAFGVMGLFVGPVVMRAIALVHGESGIRSAIEVAKLAPIGVWLNL